MVAKRQLKVKSRKPKGKAFCFLLFIFCFSPISCSGYLFAADGNDGSVPARYRVEALKNISGEQGKKYLAELGIGTVSQLPGTNTLLVTAPSHELIKASAVLRLVDTDGRFVIKAILPASESKKLPSNSTIAAEVGNISIGTFFDPPPRAAADRAIIDVHNDDVVVIAAAKQIEKITSAIERLSASQAKGETETPQPNTTKTAAQTEATVLLPSEPNKPRVAESNRISPAPGHKKNGNEPDELFDKLIDSLAESEKGTPEKPRQPSLPEQVKIIPPAAAVREHVEQANVPSKLTIDSNQIKQSTPEATEQPQQPQEVKTSKAEETIEKPQPEFKLEPNQPTVKTEKLHKTDSTLKRKGKTQTPVAETNAPGPTYETAADGGGEEELELDLPEKLEIVALLDFVGKHLGLDYMYDPAKVKGEISLKIQGPIKVKELYPYLERMMKFKGFVMTRVGNLVTVVPQEEALDIDPGLYTDVGKVSRGDVIITRVFQLKYIDQTSAKNLLTNMKIGVSGVSGNVEPIPGTSSIAVTDYAYRMARTEQILKLVDLPGKPRKFRFRQLKYTMAQTLTPKIQGLAEQLGTVSVTIAAKAEEEKPAQTPVRRPVRQAPQPQKPPETTKPAETTEPSVYLDADERTNRILMIGFDEQLDVVDGLIDALDVEQQDLRTLRLYEIKYVGADEIKEKLAELGVISSEERTHFRGRDRYRDRETITPPREPRPPTTTTAEEPLAEEPQVVTIEGTNSLLVNGTAQQHTQVAMIIAYMDVEPEQAAINYIVYQLENQDPTELASVLNQLITETVAAGKEAKGGDKISATAPTSTVTTAARKIEEDITIVPDAKTYSLIVYASKKNQTWIGALIKQLDEYRPQVLLDATLVEITKSDEFTFDLDLVTKFPKLVAGANMVSLPALLAPFPANRLAEATANSGVGKGFYADHHIQALLTIMDTKGYGRILARPKLLVNDNEPGTIKAEETTYIVRTQTTLVPGTTTGTSTTLEQQSFDPYSAGITLEITPHISKGNNLRLIIKMERSDFRITSEVTSSGKPPDQVKSNVDTVVTVPDGTTIILGGLERLNQSKSGTKIPLLGDVPMVGGLFRSTTKSDVQSRLYVFVKAHILRPGEKVTGGSDMEVVSLKNRAAFEEFEQKFQKYEDWPGTKPEPMDPIKVLEAD